MHPHTLYVLALILFVAAAVATWTATTHRAFAPLALTCCGLACWITPTALQLTP
jgi:hypothetical protein